MNRLLNRLAAAERIALALDVDRQSLYRAVAAVRQNLHSPDPLTSAGVCDRTWALTFYGCDGVSPLVGCPVVLHQPSGPTLASGTTDGAGLATLSTSEAGVSSNIQAYPDTPRFDPNDYSVTGACGATTTDNVFLVIGLTANASYFCTAFCAWPIKRSLQIVDPDLGVTLALTDVGGDVFQGSATVVYAACGGCAARAALTVDYTADFVAGTITAQHTGSVGGCPNNAGGTFWTLSWDMLIACYDGTPGSFSATGINFDDGGGSKLYCGATPAPVVTEV